MNALQAYRDQQSHQHIWVAMDSAIEQCECGLLRMTTERFEPCVPG